MADKVEELEEQREYYSEGKDNGRRYLSGRLPLTLLLALVLALVVFGIFGQSPQATNSVAGSCEDTPRSYPLGFYTTCDVTFASYVSYEQAIHIVTNLGLQPSLFCPTSSAATINGQHLTLLTRWRPLSQQAIFQRWHSLLVYLTPLTIDDALLGRIWTYQLQYYTPGVVALHSFANLPNFADIGYTCGPGIIRSAVTPTTPLVLGDGPPIYSRVAFQLVPYDEALAKITNLGIRLADPCFETAYQTPNAQLPPLVQGQEAPFSVTHTLVVATSHAASTLWRSQLRATPGVSKVTSVSASYCVP